MNRLTAILSLMRPLQWIKNGFIFTGIFFSERHLDSHLFFQIVVTVVAFSLMSSCVYILNDLVDREIDRHHPKKKNRPLSLGKISISFAISFALILGMLALFLSYWVSYKVLFIISAYVILNIVYSLKLKNIVIIDVFCIAAGFMLRILSGTVGVGIPPSKWLLLCSLMLTLFLGFAKRRAEMIALAGSREEHRKVLQSYGPILLDEIIAICATSVIITYSLYTMNPETMIIHQTENLIYTVPFVIYALFRYIFLLHHTQSGEDPTRDLLKDPHIMFSVLGWAVLLIYLH